MAKNPTPEQWAAAVLKRVGIPQSPGALQAMVGWAKAEGGHWNNDARYNPLNTTQPMPGAGNTGSQGNIKVYTSWQQGIDATAKTLKNGYYGGILRALKQGDARGVATAIGHTPWGTSGDLVARTIASTPAIKGAKPLAAPKVRAPSGSAQSPAPQMYGSVTTPGVDNSALRRQLVGQFLSQGGIKNSSAVLGLAAQYGQAADVPGITTTKKVRAPSQGSTSTRASGGARISPHAKAGDPVVSSKQSVGGQHETAGLAGYPAKDYFAPAGTHAVAPVSGKVIKLSGHDPKGGPTNGPHGPLGWSVYIKGNDGKTYFLTHMGDRNVKVGQKVKQGQVIGTVANYDKYGTPSHIHQGVEG